MMAPISAEEQNFVRLMLLLNGVTPRAVRTLFDKIFPHTNLNATLQANRHILESRKNLNQAQLDLLFPKLNGMFLTINVFGFVYDVDVDNSYNNTFVITQYDKSTVVLVS